MAVYFIIDSSSHVKIGHAQDPLARLQALQCGSPDSLSLMRVVDGGQKTERWFHKKFADRRVRGEWFLFCQGMLDTPAPDELPETRRNVHKPFASLAEYLRAADRIGCLSEDMRRDFAPILEAAE